MAKPAKKLSRAERARRRAAKKQRQKDFMYVFMSGRQIRVRRPPTIDGLEIEEFIRRNPDPGMKGEFDPWI